MFQGCVVPGPMATFLRRSQIVMRAAWGRVMVGLAERPAMNVPFRVSLSQLNLYGTSSCSLQTE